MHPLAQFVGQNLMDKTLAVDAREPGKRRAADLDAEVGLAFRPGTGMPGVPVRFIHDDKTDGRQRLGDLGFDTVGDAAHLWA